MKIKQKIRGMIPEQVREWVWDMVRAPMNMLGHYASDALRFWRHNIRSGRRSPKFLMKNMMTYTHMVEKGLSLREPRPFFGRDVVKRLMQLVDEPGAECGVSSEIITGVVRVLKSYVEFHEERIETDEHEQYLSGIREFLAGHPEGLQDPDAVISQTREDVLRIAAGGSVSEQLKSRHSVRVYDDRPVPIETIMSAVETAQSSPSACNLQPVRVHAITDRELIEKALTVQGGARGFYSEVKLLFVMTYEIGLQIGPRSRNQGYVDGGIFSQNLMLALLQEGVGSCPLNWAQERSTDRAMRNLVGIKDSENIIMLIAAGFVPPEYSVARSQRVPVESIVSHVNS
jgi:nitroreductase